MNSIPLTFRAAPFPEGYKATPEQFKNDLVARLYAESAESISFFASGSVAPSSNVGPWLKNGTEWWVWSDGDAAYVPITISPESIGYYIGSTEPDPSVYNFWIETTVGGSPTALKTYYSGAWVDAYATVNATGQLSGKGTTANDNAPSGYIGEYISASVQISSGIALTAATPATITSISLTAGDWDVSGIIFFEAVGASNINGLGALLYASLSTVNNSLAGFDAGGDGGVQTVGANGYSYIVNTPIKRFSLAVTTTIYLVSGVTNFTGSVNGAGTIRARRVR